MSLLENQRTADKISGIYQDLEEQLMSNIIRHIKNYKQPIASDKWLMRQLAEIGKLDKENIKIIAQSAGLSQTAAERMLQETAEEAISKIEPGMQQLLRQGLVDKAVDAGKSKRVQKTMKSFQRQAKDTLNLCNTTMLYKARDVFSSLVKDIAGKADEVTKRQSFLDTLDKEATSAVIGAKSRQQVVRDCIRRFNEKGIPAFVDKRGREWTPEAYVNMAIRNTVKNVADEMQNERFRDHGQDLIEIDSHSGARPKCAKDQGKIYSMSGESGYTTDARGNKVKYYSWKETSYGEPDGILGINCRHHKFLFIPGVSIQRYFPVDSEENDKLYKQTQTQRALERDVRKQKRECMLFQGLGDEEAFEEAAVKLKQKEARLKSFVDGNSQLHRRKDREQVVGFDKSISAKAVAANKRVQKELAEKARNDKIKSEIKAAGIKGEIELYPNTKIDVSEYAFDDKHISKERGHNVSREEAENFIREADISITRWDGRFVNYYSSNGAAFLDTENNNIRTAFRKEEFDERTIKMREVLKKYEKG